MCGTDGFFDDWDGNSSDVYVENDHSWVYLNEVAEGAREGAWMRWIAEVEKILGRSADGDQREDGFSMDVLYSLWENGTSPQEALLEASFIPGEA